MRNRSVRSLLAVVLFSLVPFVQALAAPPIAAYYDGRIPVEAIPAEKLSYVIYAFADLGDNNRCLPPSPQQRSTLAALRQLREKHGHLQLIVSIGGWSRAPQFSDIALTTASRAAFAESCIGTYLINQGFDGIDLDWEFPVHGGPNESRESDRANFTKLVREMRDQLKALGDKHHRHYILTAATPAGRWQTGGKYSVTDSYNLTAITPLLDWLNVMTYDMNNIFSPVTGFNTPLRADPSAPTPHRQRKLNNVAGAVQFYLDHGVPARKIMLGVAFYGRGFSGVPPNSGGLYQEYQGGYPHIPWKEVQSLYLTDPAWVRHWSETAQAPWLYNVEKHIFFSYDDPMSIAIKADFARSRDLKGAMIWVLGQDDAQHSLLDALASHLTERPP